MYEGREGGGGGAAAAEDSRDWEGGERTSAVLHRQATMPIGKGGVRFETAMGAGGFR